MKVRIQQLNPTVGDLGENAKRILSALEEAENAGTELLVLPELCTCGYSPMDMLQYRAFGEAVYDANERIISASQSTAIIFGTLTPNRNKRGRPYFNTALMAHRGKIIGEVHKTLLPNDDVFDEARYFEPNASIHCIEWKDKKLGVTICEDIWGSTHSSQHTPYHRNPIEELINRGSEVIVNISASPFTIRKSEDRLTMLQEHASNTHRPVFYANQAGGQGSLISDGDSMVLNSEGKVVARAPLFEESHIDVEWTDRNKVEAVDSFSPVNFPSQMERIFLALKQGLRDYLEKTGVTLDVLIGLSGGIDSALAACIAAEAIGPEHVMGAALPSEFSKKESVGDAEQLAKSLGIEFMEIPIKSLYREYLDALKPIFGNTEFGTTEENLQARIRGVLLMAMSNKFNRFLLNASNKSELAVGFCTLYGDTNGALALLSDLYKTEVYELACWLNESYYKKDIIPQEILDKPPSAELRPDQKDSDRLPEYDLLDPVIKLYLEEQKSVQEIAAAGFDLKLAEKIIKLVERNVYKRYQVPPGLKIHDKSFGRGRRWPVAGNWNNYRENTG
jgi:NAD+ synthetase